MWIDHIRIILNKNNNKTENENGDLNMNAVMYGLMEIKRKIPAPILEKTFKPVQYTQLRRDPFMPINIDNVIIERVVNGPVRRDCDAAGATETTISLQGLPLEVIAPDKYLIHVPKELTNGREITSALAVIFYSMNNVSTSSMFQGMSNSTTYNVSGCMNTNLDPMRAIGASLQPLMLSQTTNCRAVNGSTILVEDVILPGGVPHLRCILANDSTFSTLAQAAWKQFAKLCVLACKEYIYNNLTIEIDTAELVGGQELGKFKDIVESYADAGDQYEEFYEEKWRKIQFMADVPRHARFIRSLVGRFK